MNVYFLVEGRRTERKIYPRWLSYLVPELKRVDAYDAVEHNNYYLFSSEGYPTILNDIKNAVDDINRCEKYSYLVVCLDADEATVAERKEEIRQKMEASSIRLKAKLEIIIQNKCIESWFLGNRQYYPDSPGDGILKSYCRFYNVSEKDPEMMSAFPGYTTAAQFHENYLKRMLRESGISYTKQHPRIVGEPLYIKGLEKRIKETPDHLQTLTYFLDFCKTLKSLVAGHSENPVAHRECP